MNINKIPKILLVELENTGININSAMFQSKTPNEIMGIYANNKCVPFDMLRILAAMDLVIQAKDAGRYSTHPDNSAIVEFLLENGLTADKVQGIPTGKLMATLIGFTHREYTNWGEPLTKMASALRQAFAPFDEPQTQYLPCRDIAMLEINNNAVKFNFNAKTKVFEDEKSNSYSIQYLLSVESRTNTGFESIQLTISEVALLFSTLHKYTVNTDKNVLESPLQIAQREFSSIVLSKKINTSDNGQALQFYHNTKGDNRFIQLQGMDLCMLKGKALEILKRSMGMTTSEVFLMLELPTR
jgi:hypothetical protein